MANPSLLIIPDRYKAAKLYSQLPESGDGDFVVTRSTTATRVNASGLIESVASGVPRLDYTGGGCPALLVEPAATNLLVRSEELDNAAWSGGSTLLVNANVTTSPDGTINADRIIGDGTFGVKNRNSPSVSVTSGATYTLSCFAKQDTTSLFQVWFSTATFGANQYANFNLQTGVVAFQSAGLVSARIIDYGEGWYRCVITGTATATATGTPGGVALTDLTTNRLPSFTTANGLFAWGAQVETGSVATSYIPTVAATQTRNADVISLSSVSGLIGQTEGSVYAEVDISNADKSIIRIILGISDGSAANRFSIRRDTNGRIIVICVVGGSTIGFVQTAATDQIGFFKIAAAYAANDLTMYINGALVGSTTIASAPACSRVDIGKVEGTGTSNFLNDRISAAAIYTSRLSNAELASLTSL